MAIRALYENRIKDYVWLEISDDVTRWKATLYSSDNAVANRSIINSDPNTALDSDSIQAEILILGGLNAKWINFPTTTGSSKTPTTRMSRNEPGFDIPF